MKKFFTIFMLILTAAQAFALELYQTDAVVSFYAGDFHGKKTSNGENFDMNALTCANKSLPFDTVLRVTNLANGLSVDVRVNDRGPFVADRELDLSRAAAEKIAMIKAGTAHVKIEIVSRGPETKLSQQTAAKAAQIVGKKASAATAAYPAGTYWDFQLASFSSRENANVLAQKLLKEGFKDVVFQKTSTSVRVILRKVPAADISLTEKKLKENGYSGYIIRQRKKSK